MDVEFVVKKNLISLLILKEIDNIQIFTKKDLKDYKKLAKLFNLDIIIEKSYNNIRIEKKDLTNTTSCFGDIEKYNFLNIIKNDLIDFEKNYSNYFCDKISMTAFSTNYDLPIIIKIK